MFPVLMFYGIISKMQILNCQSKRIKHLLWSIAELFLSKLPNKDEIKKLVLSYLI